MSIFIYTNKFNQYGDLIWNSILKDCNSLLFLNNKNIVLPRRTTITTNGMHRIPGLEFMKQLLSKLVTLTHLLIDP